jgi:hypothetical protein
MICATKEALQGFVRDMGSHLRREGVWEWEERRPKKVAVAAMIGHPAIHRRVHMHLTPLMIVPCMAVNGESVLPDMIRPLELDTLPQGLGKEGIGFE